ncbi:MAG: DUF6115 domain-containing protein [Fervidobacterium sp.]
MNILHWLILFSTIGSLTLLWALYILQNLSHKNEKTQIDEEEERLVELMGKVRVFVDSKIEQLDKKMEEVRKLIKELNEHYIALSTLEIKNIEQKVESSIFTPVSGSFDLKENIRNDFMVINEKNSTTDGVNLASEASETYGSNDENSIEKKIFEMYVNGMEPVDIAKTLKMGVGEVQLIIDLMKRQH